MDRDYICNFMKRAIISVLIFLLLKYFTWKIILKNPPLEDISVPDTFQFIYENINAVLDSLLISCVKKTFKLTHLAGEKKTLKT